MKKTRPSVMGVHLKRFALNPRTRQNTSMFLRDLRQNRRSQYIFILSTPRRTSFSSLTPFHEVDDDTSSTSTFHSKTFFSITEHGSSITCSKVSCDILYSLFVGAFSFVLHFYLFSVFRNFISAVVITEFWALVYPEWLIHLVLVLYLISHLKVLDF